MTDDEPRGIPATGDEPRIPLTDEDRTHWWQGPCTCSICGHQHRAVVPIDIEQTEPLVPLECSECGNMTSHPDDEGDEV